MVQRELAVAITLAATAVGSLGVYLLFGPREEGKIQLPTFVQDGESLQRDPFDVATPEDLSDGTPVNEEAFWSRIRVWKLVLAVVLAATAVAQGVSLGFAIVDGEKHVIATNALDMAFAVYTFVVVALAVSQRDSYHVHAIYHLFALLALAFVARFTLAILPSSEHAQDTDDSFVPRALYYAVIALNAVAASVVMSIQTGPPLHMPSENVFSQKALMLVTNKKEINVTGFIGASIWETYLYSYATDVVMLGNNAESVEIADLPIIQSEMRAPTLYTLMRGAMRRYHLRIGTWRPKPGSGWELAYRLARVNQDMLRTVVSLAFVSAFVWYVPYFFLQRLVLYLEEDPLRLDRSWGWVFCVGLFFSKASGAILVDQMFNITFVRLFNRLQNELNTLLFAKTLSRKDVVSASPAAKSDDAAANGGDAQADAEAKEKEEEDEFASKSQVMTLMTTDVQRVGQFALQLFTIIDSPVELAIGTFFLYKILGVSCFIGLAVTCLFLPVNHFAGKAVVGTQKSLMKARDERTSLMNEILGAIRMLKFMAWERSFEDRVMKIRDVELKYQRRTFLIQCLFTAVWTASPMFVILVSFWHYTVIRGQVLTPSVAFTSISIFNEMKFALNALPETFINVLQTFVSLRRIEKYLHGDEVSEVPPVDNQPHPIIVQSATITWPQRRALVSAPSTPANRFVLMDMTLRFPLGELSLICGKLGSGKSLLLLGLLGEADVLAGQLISPRTPPDFIAAYTRPDLTDEEWVVEGVCAYVPQTAWLRNASIRDNILFELPYVEERYQKTLEVCALLSDLQILEDGDQAEIGERGVNLSGGQKARVSLARAVYSRASVLLLDDVLSAVDAHTAHHLYYECLKGDLMRGRTVILVSHHVQLCYPGASYVVTLDNGRVEFEGDREKFKASGVLNSLVQSGATDPNDEKEEAAEHPVEEVLDEKKADSEGSSTAAPTIAEVDDKPEQKKAPRKLIEEEKRAVGHINKDIWVAYFTAAGGFGYWFLLAAFMAIAALGPVSDNGWLRIWSGAALESDNPRSPLFYMGIYALITFIVLFFWVGRFLVLYHGTIRASRVLYRRLLEGVLFANVRFHDTTSRGRLLNRFGKDFESVDSTLPDDFARSFGWSLSVIVTFTTIAIVGGPLFVLALALLGVVYYNVGKVYGQTARDMRRLSSIARSPLYSMYGETIAGVTVVRAFGASSKFLRDMLRCVDTNASPTFWGSAVNRWLSARFSLLSAVLVAVVGFIAVLSTTITASLAGFTLTFALSVTYEMIWLVQRFVSLELSMVAVERIKEFSEIQREAPEFVEPRPEAEWPAKGAIKAEGLVIRYAPDLPNVLHNLNFEVKPGEKVGVLGRTGSGKSTLALSFFRFVEPTEGRIVIDDIDITKVGLTDLRSKLTIIPQDPTILSGTIRSMLDVFNEYDDAEIFEALRRVHLIPSADTPAELTGVINANAFRDLDSPVSEGGENFSTGEKQLLCMARAILKRSKVLLMDEATASVDYATDELIGKTIRQEFADSTILTIAHRLRTIIDYDRIMLLDQGRIVEFDAPATLLADQNSLFHGLCKATGKNEFSVLKKMAGVA